MNKKIFIYRRNRGADHFSLKKTFKKIGNVAKDAVKLGVQPVKLAVASVTGKPVNTTYSTKLGAVVGKVHDTGNKALTSTAKGFADTITGGLATKAANVLRKDKYKEKAFAYNEMKNSGGPSFGKTLDKVATVLPTVGAVAGGVVAGAMAGNKALSLGKKQEQSNMKDSNIEIGQNVLTGQTPLQLEKPVEYQKPRFESEPYTGGPASYRNMVSDQQPSDNKLTASMDLGFGKLTPMTIGIIVVAIILLVVAVKNKK